MQKRVRPGTSWVGNTFSSWVLKDLIPDQAPRSRQLPCNEDISKREARLNTRLCQTKHCSGVISSSGCSDYGESLCLPPIMGTFRVYFPDVGVTGTHSWRSQPRSECPGDIGEDTTATKCQNVQPGRNCTPESRPRVGCYSGLFLGFSFPV